MKVFILKKAISYLTVSVTLLVLFNACRNNSTSTNSSPDFSTVPAPWDTSMADTTFTKDNGDLTIYVLKKGNGIFKVTERDQVTIRYTGRTKNGTIFISSWSDGHTDPVFIYNLYPYTTTSGAKNIEGLRQAILGMSEGERRTVIVPPILGYGNYISTGVNGYDLRSDTLIYDIELVRILS